MNKYLLGLELLVIGMGTVFLSLYLLSVFLYFSGKFLGPKNIDKKKTGAKVKSDKNIIEQKKEKAPLDEGISAKKAAVITAAVYKSLNKKKHYQIISIKKSKQKHRR